MHTIAERLLVLRGKKTQIHFAQQLHVNVNTLRAYEKGRVQPSFEFLSALCVVFSVSATWILTGEGSIYKQDFPQHDEPPAMGCGYQQFCTRCPRLEKKLDKMEQERCEKENEIRLLMAENRQLWKENGELREKMVRLELQKG